MPINQQGSYAGIVPALFDYARARTSHIPAPAVADTDRASSPGSLSAFGGGREDPKISTRRYPTCTPVDRREI
jgi:hypothetical protein